MATTPITNATALNTDSVQELSMQWIDFNRTLRYLKEYKNISKSSELTKVLNKVVTKYNSTHEQNFEYVPCQFKDRSYNYKRHVYVRNMTAKPRLRNTINKAKQDKSQKINIRQGSEVLIFFIREVFSKANSEKDIVALSSGQAWHVVRDCVHHEYPIKIAERILDANSIQKIQRRSLIGPNLQETVLRPPNGELYKMKHLYYLIESIDCLVRKNAPLMDLKPFNGQHEPKIKITTGGLLRIQKSLSLDDYPSILNLFYQYTHDKEVYSSKGEIEYQDPQFEFLHFLQPAQISKKRLDEEIVEQALTIYEGEENTRPVLFRDKHLNDYLESSNFTIQFQKGQRFQPLTSRPPSLYEVLDAIQDNLEGRLHHKVLLRTLRQGVLKYYNVQNQQTKQASLIDCLEGEVRYEDNSYFKIRGMWYQLSADFNALLREDFRSLLLQTFIRPGIEGQLPLPWRGNNPNNLLTENRVKKATGIKKAIRQFMDCLLKTPVCYVNENLTINQSKLQGEILDQKVISKNKETIEKILSEKSKTTLDKRINAAFPDQGKEILMALQVKRSFLKIDSKSKKKTVLNPLTYPFKAQCKEKYDQFEELIQELYNNNLKEDEATYNRSYLYDKKNKDRFFDEKEGYLVFDCILPNKIEPCDIVYYTPSTTYLYHVKEDLGQHTREACSQIINAAKAMRAALSLHQSKNFLQMLWEAGTVGSKGGWRDKLKDQLKHLGERHFFDIFYKRKVVFVYAYLEKPGHSLLKEITTPIRLSPDHLRGESQQEQFELLKKQGYIDSRNRLTGQFYTSSLEKFKLEDCEEVESQQIYFQLQKFKSVSESTLAKLELIHLSSELQALGFDFKICAIKHPDSSPVIQEEDENTFHIDDIFQFDGTLRSESLDESDHIKDPRGITNIGNSCYINANLQVLFGIDELSELITKQSYPALYNAYHNRVDIKNLQQLRKEIFKNRLNGNLTGQQDAHELLCKILEELEWSPIEIHSKFTYQLPNQKESSIKYKKDQKTHHLSLAIEKNKNFQETVNAFFNEEELEDPYDIKSKGKTYSVKASKALRISQWPDILVIHLKRFNKMGKITHRVDMPDDGIITIEQDDDSAVSYEIIAYINHHGDDQRHGHYTADIKALSSSDKPWTHYDDANVEDLAAPSNPHKEAYIIFLRQI